MAGQKSTILELGDSFLLAAPPHHAPKSFSLVMPVPSSQDEPHIRNVSNVLAQR